MSTALSVEKAERVAALDNGHWSVWLAASFPQVFTKPMAWFQIEAWDLIWQCTAGAAPSPPSLIMSAFRGSSKSGTAEAAVVALLATQRRKYCVYVSGTQDSANDRVGSISDLAIGSEMLGAWHPEMAQRSWRTRRGSHAGTASESSLVTGQWSMLRGSIRKPGERSRASSAPT